MQFQARKKQQQQNETKRKNGFKKRFRCASASASAHNFCFDLCAKCQAVIANSKNAKSAGLSLAVSRWP